MTLTQETPAGFLGREDPLEKGIGSTPVFLGFPGGSASEESACNAGDLGLIPGLERSPGEGYPLQYSGLENSMDCIIHGVAKSDTIHYIYLTTLCTPQRIKSKPIIIVWKNLSWHEPYYPFSLISTPSPLSQSLNYLLLLCILPSFVSWRKPSLPESLHPHSSFRAQIKIFCDACLGSMTSLERTDHCLLCI